MTDAEKLKAHLESLPDHAFVAFYRQAIRGAPVTLDLPGKSKYLDEILELEKTAPAYWGDALRLAGIRSHNPKVYAQMEPIYLTLERDILVNWQWYPASGPNAARQKPTADLNVIWCFGRNSYRAVLHPNEFEHFLARSPYFTVSSERAGNGSPMFELSELGLLWQRRFKRTRWIKAALKRTGTRTLKWLKSCFASDTLRKILIGLIVTVLGSLIFWCIQTRLSEPVLPRTGPSHSPKQDGGRTARSRDSGGTLR